MKKKTGILYFSFAPNQDAGYKKWTDSKRRNIALSKILYKSTKSKLLRHGLDVIETISGKSLTKGFGYNLADAIEESFSLGYNQLIIVGNDCPQLSQEDLQQSIEALYDDQLCMGITPKGGSYLFSIKKTTWNKNQFVNLAWCTTRLAAELQNYLSVFDTVIQLESKIDLNDLPEIYDYISSHRTALSLLMGSLMTNFLLFGFKNPFKLELTLNKQFLRGPPLAH